MTEKKIESGDLTYVHFDGKNPQVIPGCGLALVHGVNCLPSDVAKSLLKSKLVKNVSAQAVKAYEKARTEFEGELSDKVFRDGGSDVTVDVNSDEEETDG